MRRALAVFVAAALAGGGAFPIGCSKPAPRREEAEAVLEGLRAERTALRDRLRGLLSKEARLLDAPRATVIIGVPTSLTRSLVEQTVTGLFDEVTLRLRDIKVHKADEVRAKTLFGGMTLGTFVLDVTIREVKGVLHPGKPQLTFGGNRIGVALPVSLTAGSGRATLRFRWEGRKIAGAVCGDLDVSHEVKGAALPATYPVKGAFRLAAEGSDVVLEPEFGEITVKVRVEPSKETWDFVDRLIAQQGGICETALRKVDVPQRIRDLIGRGFDVKLPRRLFRPIRLPAGLEQSLSLGGRPFTLEVRPIGLVVTPLRLWYGADVTARPD